MRNGRHTFCRQPILNRGMRIQAYELLYRSGDDSEARVEDDARATSEVIHLAFARQPAGIFLGHCRGFVNFDAEMLMSARPEALPREQVILELLETIQVDDAVVRRCGDLKERGYHLALDDVCRRDASLEPLLDLVDVVKIDILQVDDARLAELVGWLKPHPLRLLAEKVDSLERASRCLALGFDLFQGFFFGRPQRARL